ncbi:MFS transporter [Pseudonocardia aurantiaca]|uniref:MFS transporter n=1 Tax=Pseudonocardia aurantiaca TaxID=75290 RepID=A0ABW4FGS8_9PSEU
MTAEALSTQPSSEVHPRRWAAMVVLVLAFMLDLLNVTIVNVGLPAIQRDLRASPTELEWISAAYLLAFAVALITAARLGDLWGRKRVFLVGLTAFGLAGLWCSVAHNPAELIAARAAQGLAAAVLAPQVMSTLYTMFHGRERATVFGAFGIVAGFAQAGGLVLGGALITADVAGLGWRTIFLVSVPVAVLLVAAGAWLVPESRVVGGTRPRWFAAGILTAALVAIVFPLLEGRGYGWPIWCWVCLAAGVLAVAGLAFAEHRRPAWRAGALLPVELFRSRAVAAGLTVQLLAFAGFSGFLLVFALWLQDGQGYSPLDAGLVTIGFSAGSLVIAPFTGRLTIRFGRLVVLVGCLLSSVGALGVLAAAQSTSHAVGSWSLVPGLFALGVGINLVMPALVTLFLAAVPPEYAGSASGIWNTSQQFGGAVGVAVLGSIFFGGLDTGSYPAAFTASTLTIVAVLVVSAALSLTLSTHSRARNA